MKGLMGECPDWYPLMAAARYMKVPPWELAKQSIWWRDKALIAMTAESQAQEIMSKQK
jgi:hypothetical protein